VLKREDKRRCKMPKGVDVVLESWSRVFFLNVEVVISVQEAKGPTKCGKLLSCLG